MTSATDRRFDIIVFDLGGVLIELTGVQRMLEWLEDGTSADELWTRWLASESVRGFECGRMNADQFAEAFLAEFGIPVSAGQFLAEFTSWPKAPYDGAGDLLRELAKNHTVACLSNTNALHWSRIDREMGLLPHFTHHFASHLVGMLKPDREIFEHMVEQLRCPPDRILFLDDNLLNVEGARAVGISAHEVKGLTGAIEKLAELGVK
ncbi:MAG: haloacid dehalogenase superfamily protein subfamily variant 3 with third motif having or [Chlorobi bacterium]|nr:haloacid dehalogenase superfamily protein subfamily variant 3 with third motif having or [Chlorobiota bacterium]